MISAKDVDVRVTLRTRQPQEAEVRQGIAVAYLDAVWRSVREGPKRLTHKELWRSLAKSTARSLTPLMMIPVQRSNGFCLRQKTLRQRLGCSVVPPS